MRSTSSIEEKLQLSRSRYKKLFDQSNFRTKELVKMSKSQDNTQLAMMNVMEDLEEAKELIELERVKDEAVLASIGEGLIAVDNNRKIMVMNKAAEQMLGWTTKEMLGKEITSLPLEDKAGNLLPLTQRPTYLAIAAGKETNANHFFVRKDKTRFPIAITVTPIMLNGKAIGAVDIFRDITREQEIDRAKSEFVSLASHQLRTPLGIMKWYLEALAEESYFKAAPPAVHGYFDAIYKSNERVLSLVRDLLSVSRIDQGSVKNVTATVNLAEVVSEIVAQMQIVAKKQNIKLSLDIADTDSLVIMLDSMRLHQVIENLIGNAIEYTEDQGRVDVKMRKVDDSIMISVSDTGIGISSVDQKKLFTKFFRAENAVAKYAEGSGLGLYVVKSYVEGWGGIVTVSSALGKGSTFTITLPLKIKEVIDT